MSPLGSASSESHIHMAKSLNLTLLPSRYGVLSKADNGFIGRRAVHLLLQRFILGLLHLVQGRAMALFKKRDEPQNRLGRQRLGVQLEGAGDQRFASDFGNESVSLQAKAMGFISFSHDSRALSIVGQPAIVPDVDHRRPSVLRQVCALGETNRIATRTTSRAKAATREVL